MTNNNKPATKKQLWALFILSKKNGKAHDYREDNLTMEQASLLIKEFIGDDAAPRAKKNDLENEFVEYMKDKMSGVIQTARQAINVKSIIETDPLVTAKENRKRYLFVGFGCGFSWLKYDKRSKLAKRIEELSDKHEYTTFLNEFKNGFTFKEQQYLESIGNSLDALYRQDIRIGQAYKQHVMRFMELKGVKNVRIETYYD